MYIECKRLVEEQNQDNWASELKQTLAGCGGIGPLVVGSQITLACSHLLFLSSRKGEVANWSFIQPKAEIIHQLENWSSYVQKVRVKSHRSLIDWEEEQHHYKLKLVDTSAFQWKRWYAVMQHRACRCMEDDQHFCVGCPALEEARAPPPLPHHVDSGTLADKDNFITIMQSPDSKRAKLLYTMFLKHTSWLYC